jgi:hypothetical protein
LRLQRRTLVAGNSRSGKLSPTEAERTNLAADTSRMTKKPEPPKPSTWVIYRLAAKRTWLGAVEAADEREAIEKAAAERKVPANKLMALRQR